MQNLILKFFNLKLSLLILDISHDAIYNKALYFDITNDIKQRLGLSSFSDEDYNYQKINLTYGYFQPSKIIKKLSE